MTAPPMPDPATAHYAAAAPEARETSETVLLTGAKRWIREAINAWTEDDHAKVALELLT